MRWELIVMLTGGLVLLAWIALVLDRTRAWPSALRLPPRPAAVAASPGVVAVVPARNEAAMLPLTLPGLLTQRAHAAVIVVDDGSDDGTAEVTRGLGSAESAGVGPELVLIAAPPRPSGWSGKVHAQAVGLEAADRRGARWILFTDADIRHRHDSVAALLEVAGEERDLVSVMARLRASSLWERLLIPPFVYFFQLLYPFALVSRPGSPRAAAAGGCMLVRREALRRAGDLEAIAAKLIDDVGLARAIRDGGGQLWLGLDPGIESVRPYQRLGEIWRMVSRNAFVQLGYRYSLLLAVVLAMTLFFVAPPLGAVAAAAAFSVHGGATLAVATVAFLGAWSLQTWHLRPAVLHHRVPGAWACTLPFAALLYELMTCSSAWSHLRGRTSTWRGRTYAGSEEQVS